MKDIQQLIKKNSQENRYKNIFPKTYIDAIKDKETNDPLGVILNRNNFLFLSYVGSVSLTRLQVPMSYRRSGLWISYQKFDKTIVVEFFRGDYIDDAHWQQDVYWFPYNTAEYQPNSVDLRALAQDVFDYITDSISDATKLNLDDLSKSDTGQIQFADRNNTHGLGYTILRKNIVGGKNILTQNMISSPNTIYEIRYDFDLNNQTITIPEGCILEFQGGSFSGGIIIGDNTKISDTTEFIFKSCTLEGTWILEEVLSSWFGAKRDDTDTTQELQKAVDFTALSKCGKLKILKGNYTITSLNVTNLSGITIEGAGMEYATISGVNSGNTRITVKGDGAVGFDLSDSKAITLKNMLLYADPTEMPDTLILMSRSLKDDGGYNHTNKNTIRSVEFYGRCKKYGLLINNAELNSFYDLSFSGYFGKSCIGILARNTEVESPFVNIIKTGVSTTCNNFYDCSILNYLLPELEGTDPNRIISCVYCSAGHFNTSFRDSYIRTVSTANNVSMKGFVIDSGPSGTGNVIEGGLIIDNIRQEGYGKVGEFLLVAGNYLAMNIDVRNCFTSTSKDYDAAINILVEIRNLYINNIHSINTSSPNKNIKISSIRNSYISVPIDGEIIFTGSYVYNSFIQSTSALPDNLIQKCDGTSVLLTVNSLDIGNLASFTKESANFNRGIKFPSSTDGYASRCAWSKVNSYNGFDLIYNNNFGDKKIAYRMAGNKENYPEMSYLGMTEAGFTFYSLENRHIPIWWDGSKWLDSTGKDYTLKVKGTTSERPILASTDSGFQYYDTTLKKLIIWNGTGWDILGTTSSSVSPSSSDYIINV